MRNIDEYIELLENNLTISLDLAFEMLTACSCMIEKDSEYSRRLCINVLNNWKKLPSPIIDEWGSLIETLGFYPYLNKEEITLTGTAESLRRYNHDSIFIQGTTHHDKQQIVLEKIFSNKNLVVSAPTSFGKSLLIEEIIASCRYENIVIIQPTLALLDETRRKLLKYSTDYKIIVRTTQKPSLERRNIYLFTAERVNEYEYFIKIDFLIIDEFYKLSGSRNDDRSSSLNNAFYKIYWKYRPQFYFLGPNIDNVSKGFLDFYNAEFYSTNYSLVDSRIIDIYKIYPGQFGTRGKKKEFTENVLFELLLEHFNEQTIIYCSSPNRVRTLAKNFTQYSKDHIEKPNVNFLVTEWIKENISQKWMLLEALDYCIGIHDGALQKHITTSIIDYFNSGKIKYLFCTSTIIEGVNTSAKNIIYFDRMKGPNKVDYFDYSNIKGRAGRMMQHYVGKIYNFYGPPLKERIEIDIPVYDQNPVKDEVLIQIDENHVKDKKSKQYQDILSIPSDELNIIRKNGVNVKGQKQIIDKLMNELPAKETLYNWSTNPFPKYHQMQAVLGLAWDNLITSTEIVKPMTKDKLVHFTMSYLYHHDEAYLIKSQFDFFSKQKEFINKSENDIYDAAIQNVFQNIKHWMQYKVPKWLSVISELQKFVCTKKGIKPGDYIGVANLLENGFVPENLSILLEYGIPASAIRKLKKTLPNDINQDDIFDYIKKHDLIEKVDLIEYEKDKIRQNLLL